MWQRIGVYQCHGELSSAAWWRAHVSNLIIFIFRFQNFNHFRDPHTLYELVRGCWQFDRGGSTLWSIKSALAAPWRKNMACCTSKDTDFHCRFWFDVIRFWFSLGCCKRCISKLAATWGHQAIDAFFNCYRLQILPLADWRRLFSRHLEYDALCLSWPTLSIRPISSLSLSNSLSLSLSLSLSFSRSLSF